MESPVSIYEEALSKVKRSEEFQRDTLEYARRLERRGLPIIFSPKHLALHLGIDYSTLMSYTRYSEEYYYYFLISKKSGNGKRRVIAPYPKLRGIQKWIQKMILDKQEMQPYVTGFTKEKSILDNANPHKGKKYILKCDISDFFESIEDYQVREVFRKMGYTRQVAYTLAQLCTSKISEWNYEKLDEEEKEAFAPLAGRILPFLIQGAPTSPALANLVSRHIDERMMGYCKKHNVAYTRYADDMTFSSDDKENLPSLALIRKILESSGFYLNEKKTQLLSAKGRQYVTGLLVDDRVRVPGKYKKEIFRHLHFCLKYGGRTHFKHVAPDKQFYREWLLGKIYYVNAIEPEVAKKMMELAKQVDWLK